MADEIKIELVADADGVIRAVKKVGPAGKKAVKPLNDGLDKAKNTSEKIGGVYAKILSIASAISGIAIGAAFKEGLADLAEFNLKLAEVNTLLPITNRISSKTERAIRSLSMAYGKDNRDLAAAYYDVISAGSTDAKESIELLEAATKASVGGVTDVKTATGAILSVMNAYGKENVSAAEAAEKLFAIVKDGRTTFEELGSSIGMVVPTAAQLGIGISELGGMLAVSTRISGSTSKSVNQLNAAFANILKPSEMAKKQIERLNKEFGLTLDFSAQALKEKGVQRFFQEIFDATEGLDDAETILSELFGSVEALRGVLSITGDNFDQVKESIDKIKNSTTALDEGFGVISETLSAKFDKAIQSTMNLFQKFIKLLEPSLKSLIDKFNKLAIAGNVLFDIFLGGALGENDGATGSWGDGIADQANKAKEAIDGLNTSLVTGIPAMSSALDTLEAAMKKVAESLETGFDKGKEKLFDFGFTVKKVSMDIGAQLSQALVKVLSFSIQHFTKGLMEGKLSAADFAKSVLSMLGDMAIQIGEMLMLAGVGMKGLINLTPMQALAAGAGLVAIGTIMKSFAGGGGSESSSIPSPVTPIGNESVGTVGPLDNVLGSEEPEAIERQQVVQLTVQGSIFNTEETSKQIIDILNDEFDNQGGRIAYA